MIILMIGSCHEQHHTALMTKAVDAGHLPLGCLCTTGHYMGQQSTTVYMMASAVCLALVCSTLALSV